MLSAALFDVGVHIASYQIHSVHHRPGAGVTVGYECQIVTNEGLPIEEPLYLYASTGSIGEPSTPLVRLTHPVTGQSVAVWRHPADPVLPALPIATDIAQLSAVIGPVNAIDLVVYRPTRRAVLRAHRASGDVVYVKVVRPTKAADLAHRHEMLTATGIPAPPVLASHEAGLVAFGEGTGVGLANLLARGLDIQSGPHQALAVLDALIAVLDALPAQVMSLDARPAWSERIDLYGHASTTLLPQEAGRIAAVVAGVTAALAATDRGPLVPSHGDFYEANVLFAPDLNPPRVQTLLDVDTIGPGYRVDDLACLLAHVSVLPGLAPAVYPHVPAILQVWTARCQQMVNPVNLAARAAAVTLSLVPGVSPTDPRGTDVALGRLATAEQWLALAQRA